MSTQPIAARIEAKDWALLDKPVPKQQVGDVIPLLEHSDSEVRELAVQVLAQIGGPAAKQSLFGALQDENGMVRGSAARALRELAAPDDVERAVGQLTHEEDEFVREQMALLLGRLGEAAAVEPLRAQHKAETYPEARHAMSLALARLNDAEHRQALVRRLREDDPKSRAAALEDLLYVQDRSLALETRPLLNDQRDAKNVGPSHGPLWIRVCDVTINVLDQLLDHPFPFPIEYGKRYAPSEIEQAESALRKMVTR